MERGRRELWLPLGAFVVLGFSAALGAAWPLAHRELHAPVALLGLVFLLQAGTYTLGAAATGPLLARFRLGPVLALSALFAAACFTGLALARDSATFVVAAALLNAALGTIDAGFNAQVAVHGGLRRLGWLHAAWGLGAALGPAAIAAAEASLGSWRPPFLLFALGMLVAAVGSLATPWTPLAPAAGTDRGDGRAGRWLAMASAVMVASTALEASVGLWSPTGLDHRGVGAAAAAAAAAVYFAGLTGGRVLLGLVRGLEERMPDLLAACGMVSLVGTLAFWALPPAPATGALFVIGAALAPIVPLLNRLTSNRLGAGATARAVGYQMAIGVGGGGLAPSALGAGVQAAGAGVLAPAFVACALILGVLSNAVRRW